MREGNLLRAIMLRLSKHGSIIFRNNIGSAFAPDGTKRVIRYGVCNPGGSDIIGFTKIKITPEMVGKEVAVFTAVEVKTVTGKKRTAQENFIRVVNSSGGIAGFVKTEDEAVRLIERWPGK